jgi:outer membrane receptor protein involved in Fe transport
LARSPEYQFERLKRPDAFTGAERFTRLDTHRIGLGISFFHPSGLTARIQPTYVDQDGDFVMAGPFGGTERDSDRFWVMDASLSYRLPKRWGIVSIEVKNLFDESFRFQDTDPSNPSIVPESWVLARFTLDF